MSKRVLIIDDSDSIVVALGLLFENAGFVVLNSEIMNSEEKIEVAIKMLKPDIILLDHDLGNRLTGLAIARKNLMNGLLILSTSISVTSSEELTKEYIKAGVDHFPGKTFSEIIKCIECIEGNCGCYLPAIPLSS